jgi:PKD repeat protein
VVTRQALAVVAVLAITGCALDKQPAPALSGPSEMGLSISVSVTPDIITQDGQSEATVSVLVLDASNRPVVGLSMRVDTSVRGSVIDTFGQLVSRNISTDSSGRASVRYISPPAPPANANATDEIVTFHVRPIGSSFGTETARTVQLQVSPSTVRLGPNGTPIADFTFSPTTPKELEAVHFNASASKDDGQIVSYSWTFGDGSASSGVSPVHSYHLAGKYIVTLTVTDDRGLSASKTQEVTVSASVLPTASFAISPTDPVVGQNVHVNAQLSTAAPGRSIASWEWDFGDGTFGSGELSHHAYDRVGTFTITLRVRDNTGAVGTTSKTVTIKP